MDEKIKEIMADTLDTTVARIDDSTAMDNTATWDSLAHLNLCLALEQEFGVTLEVDEMETMISFYDILQVLQDKL